MSFLQLVRVQVAFQAYLSPKPPKGATHGFRMPANANNIIRYTMDV